jgi:serine/threonine protein kinase
MAELFLARAQGVHGFEKLVVLKRILPQHAESEDFIRMFLTEARLAATLHHPNIVQVYDIGEDQGAHFFTMEYVQGQDLRKLVRAARRQQMPIPLEHILHVIMGVASGLHHAHDKVGMDGRPLGIVHRDVSPSNVLVTYEGGVKIVDFGIAKAATAQVATIAGTLKGKIPYMSPEQCRGEGVDRRSDIFSIGTLLWELTTGKRLFAGDNEFAILNRVAKGDVPLPSAIRPDYPPELEAIVMRALQPEPDQRYPTAQDLQIDIEDFAREARLPVSSARMSKFMSELFAEEIRDTADEISREQSVAAPPVEVQPAHAYDPHTMGPRTPLAGIPVSTLRAPDGTPVETLEGHEYTPSELRQHGAATGSGPGSDTTSAGAEIPLDEVPGRMRTGPVLAVGAGLIAAIAVAGALAWQANQDAESEVVTPKIEVITSDKPVPDQEAEPEAEPEARSYSFGAAKPGTPDAQPAPEEDGQEADAEAEAEVAQEPPEPKAPAPKPKSRAPSSEKPDSGGTDPEDDTAKVLPKRPSKKPAREPKDDKPKKRDVNALWPYE